MHINLTITCFLIGFSKTAGALSLVKMVTRGSLLDETKSAISDFTNWPPTKTGGEDTSS